jgi:hypothetical protein
LLTPCWQDPTQFHEHKSELLAQLRAIVGHPVPVRTVVRFVPAPCAALPPASSLAAFPQTRPRWPAKQHRYPHPAWPQPGNPCSASSRKSRSEGNLIVAPVREHSRKPDGIYDQTEALVARPLRRAVRPQAPEMLRTALCRDGRGVRRGCK